MPSSYCQKEESDSEGALFLRNSEPAPILQRPLLQKKEFPELPEERQDAQKEG